MIRRGTRPGWLSRLTRHPIVHNTVALYAIQFASYVLPLLTVPYLARVLGPAEFGAVAFAQSFSILLALLVEYGFGMSAVREVARRRDDARVLARTVADVLGARAVLAAAALVAAVVALITVPLFRRDPDYALFAWTMAVTATANPRWFFVGLERMRLPAAIDVVSRLLAVGLILLLVQGAGDGWKVLALSTAGNALSLVIQTVLVYREVSPQRPRLSPARAALRSGWTYFVGTAAISLYTTANVFVLGLVVSSAQVALFAGPEKVVRAATRLVAPLSAVVFPRISFLVARGEHAPARRIAQATFAVVTGTGVICALVFIVFAPEIVDIVLGQGFEDAVPTLRILALLVPLIAAATVLGGQWLLPNGFERTLTRIVLVAGALNVAVGLVMASAFGVQGMAWTVVGAEALVVVASAVAVTRIHGTPRAIPDRPEQAVEPAEP